MASGKLGISAPLAATNTIVYSVTSPVAVATFNVNIVNTTQMQIKVRLAISASGTPAASEWLEYDTTLEPSSVLERTSLAASQGEKVVVYASAAGLAVRVYGFEQ